MGHSSAIATPLPPMACGTRLLTDVRLHWVSFIGSIFALLVLATPVFAQTMPENASAKSYGDGWECNVGYRHVGDVCSAVTAPENAYKTNRTYGPGWECLHGFRTVEGTACVAVVVPDGGFLDPSGLRWHCLRGFLKVDDRCQKVIVPENAYLVDASYGSAWECERGFEQVGEFCTAIAVPINGYLNGSRYGQPWTCERGFFEQGSLCEPVVIPKHAYFDDATYGEGWKCERGYAASGTRCEAIDIPANAHLDRSGNRWECHKNFQRSKGQCLFNN